jgi:hypothetical protein
MYKKIGSLIVLFALVVALNARSAKAQAPSVAIGGAGVEEAVPAKGNPTLRPNAQPTPPALETWSLCTTCFSCGGAWPNFEGHQIVIACNSNGSNCPLERGSACGSARDCAGFGFSNCHHDADPFLCCR